jgi:molybdate transport system substrate-binding protein
MVEMTRVKLRLILSTLALVLLLSAACASLSAHLLSVPISLPRPAPSGSTTLTVMAAASLSEAFAHLGRQFEADHPGVRVVFNFAGSQQLAQQLAGGAAADVFASANARQMEAAIENGRVAPGAALTFAHNRLAVIFPVQNPARLTEIKDLARPGLKLVFAAQEVPVGQYTLEFLEKAGRDPRFGAPFKEAVLGNVVSYEENVKGVLTKVALGEADAGIVYASDIPEGAVGKVRQIPIPRHLNVTAAYPIVVVTDSRHPELAAAFVELVLSQTGQGILAEYGFVPIED